MRTAALAAALLAGALPASGQDQTRQTMESKLRNLKVSLDFKDAPLDAVVDYLREISDMNIFVDAKVREKNLVVNLKVSEIALRSAFSLMLKPHGCDTMYKDGVLMVMTQEDVVDKTLKMEIYDCRDILYPIQDFPGVDIQLAQDSIGTVIAGGDATTSGEMPIEELVKAHTGGRSWDDNPKCTARLQNGLLVIKNTPEVHKQVVRLLNLLRRNK
jgi:type II secretory pathway component GspD/PulD (secretin)